MAVVRNQGKREALGPGRYRLEAPGQVFEKFMYTGVRTSNPEEIITYDSQRIPLRYDLCFGHSGLAPLAKLALLSSVMKSYACARLTFTVTYEIVDPSKAAQFRAKESEAVDVDDLDVFLRTACHSCLRASVNHTHLLHMGKGMLFTDVRAMKGVNLHTCLCC